MLERTWLLFIQRVASRYLFSNDRGMLRLLPFAFVGVAAIAENQQLTRVLSSGGLFILRPSGAVTH